VKTLYAYGELSCWCLCHFRVRGTWNWRRALGKQNVQLFTKWCPSPGRMTKEVVSKAIDVSLRKMRTSCLHLIQFHWGDYSNTEYITALKHMQDLQTEGKILHLGLTNFNTKHLKNIVENKIKIVSNQVSYSVIDWRPELAMVPFCKQHDIKLLTYGTVLGGFLSNKYLGVARPTKLETSSQKKYIRFIESWGGWQLFQELLQVLDKIGQKHGVSISTVATRYILDKPQVGGVILGVRLSLSSNIQDNIKTFALNLDDADRSEIESVATKGKVLDGDCGDEYR